MKKIISSLIVLLSITYVQAAGCTDLTKSLVRYQENSSVLALQNFLFDAGYLKAKPNGYFGNGTFAAVKAYQKSLGFEQVGNIGPATRAAIKKATCTGATTVTASSSIKVPSQPVAITPPVVVAKTPSEIRNAKRREDAERILRALYSYYTDSRGVHATTISDTPKELCIVPKVTQLIQTASSAEVLVVATPKSPCLDYVDVTYLSPNYFTNVPRDPALATSNMLTGYTITRSEVNDITIAAKSTDDKAIIKVTCNFNGFCKDLKHISTVIYKQPEITSLSRTTFLRDATPKTPLVIYGKYFTEKNTIKLFSLYNSKEYALGDFKAVNYVVGATSTSVSIEDPIFAQTFPCGSNCSQKLPLGDYMITVTNEGGRSDTKYLTLKGFTTSAISTRIDSTIIPKTNNVKVATITISSSIPVSLKTLTLTSSSTSKNLSSKISNFVMKETTDNKTYSGGAGSFSLGNVMLYENYSKVYDIYVDIADVMNQDAGFITYGGKLLVYDSFTKSDMEIPVKEFSFSVSY